MSLTPSQISEPFLRLAVERGYLTLDKAKSLDGAPTTQSELDDLDLALRCLREKTLTSEQVVELRHAIGSSPVRNYAEFEIEKPLGRGGTGIVYAANKTSTGKYVALKILPRWLSETPPVVERFMREFGILRRLKHENIVKAIDAGAAEGRFYLAMEYLSGGTLRDLVKSRGPLDETIALSIIKSIAKALSEMNRNGLVHRDVKPRNILFTEEGIPKLADLGLATEAGRTYQKGPRRAIGTPNYFSPEQASGKPDIDIRSDIYSLGATLFYALTARPPFKGSDARKLMAAHIHLAAPDPSEYNPRVTKKCSELAMWMMEKEPTKRPRTPEDVITKIDNLHHEKKLFASESERKLFRVSLVIFLLITILGLVVIKTDSTSGETVQQIKDPAHNKTNTNVKKPILPSTANKEVKAAGLSETKKTEHEPIENLKVEPKQVKNPQATIEAKSKTTVVKPIATKEALPVVKEEKKHGDKPAEIIPQKTEPDLASQKIEMQKILSLSEKFYPLVSQRNYEAALELVYRARSKNSFSDKALSIIDEDVVFISSCMNIFESLSKVLEANIGNTLELEFKNGIKTTGKLTKVTGAESFQLDGNATFAIRSLASDFIISTLGFREGVGVHRRLAPLFLIAEGEFDKATYEIEKATKSGASVDDLKSRLLLAKAIHLRYLTKKLSASQKKKEKEAASVFEKAAKAHESGLWELAVKHYRNIILNYLDTELATKQKAIIQEHYVHASHELLEKNGVLNASKIVPASGENGTPTYIYYFEQSAKKELKDFKFDSQRWRARRGQLEHIGTSLWKYPFISRASFGHVDEIKLTYKVDYPGYLGISFCGISVLFLFMQNEVAAYKGKLTAYGSNVRKSLLDQAPSSNRIQTERTHRIQITIKDNRLRFVLDGNFLEDLSLPAPQTPGPIEIRDTQRCRILDLSISGQIDSKWLENEKAKIADKIAEEADY